jgi:hypothetical protein
VGHVLRSSSRVQLHRARRLVHHHALLSDLGDGPGLSRSLGLVSLSRRRAPNPCFLLRSSLAFLFAIFSPRTLRSLSRPRPLMLSSQLPCQLVFTLIREAVLIIMRVMGLRRRGPLVLVR